MTTRTIKISFQGASRDVDVSAPFTLANLQQAVASTFSVELPPRSGADSDLSFTYKDPEGDEIVFDKDSELSLALRLCPSSLEISAAGKDKETAADKTDPERRLYQRAARNLREYHGVPSMTPAKLIKTLAFLKLGPRRLVKQGLAPKPLLARMNAEAKNEDKGPAPSPPQPLGGGKNGGDDDLAESAAAGMELMSVEDDQKEWNDGFVAVDPAASSAATATPPPASSSPDTDGATAAAAAKESKCGAADKAEKKNVIHEAFVAGGIRLRPREVKPLLLALDVRPRRLVKLGYVDNKYLDRMLHAERRANKERGGREKGDAAPNRQQRLQRVQQRMARGGGSCPAGPMRRGGPAAARGAGVGGRRVAVAGGKMCSPGKGRNGGGGGRKLRGPMPMGGMVRQSTACLPPPPPGHMIEAGGLLFGPAAGPAHAAGTDGRPGGRRGPHAHVRAHRRSRQAEGMEEGAEAMKSHRGAPRRMVRVLQARSGGRDGSRQEQHGYYFCV